MSNKFNNLKEEDLIKFLDEGSLKEDEIADFMQAMQNRGLAGSIMQLDDPNSREGKSTIEYVSYHEKIPREYFLEMPEGEIIKAQKTLLSQDSLIEDKKVALLVLAHAKKEVAREALQKYSENPNESLRTWATLALQECESFLEKNENEKPKILFKKIKSTKRNDPCPCGSGKKFKKCCLE